MLSRRAGLSATAGFSCYFLLHVFRANADPSVAFQCTLSIALS